jgi:hypothetical protein
MAGDSGHSNGHRGYPGNPRAERLDCRAAEPKSVSSNGTVSSLDWPRQRMLAANRSTTASPGSLSPSSSRNPSAFSASVTVANVACVNTLSGARMAHTRLCSTSAASMSAVENTPDIGPMMPLLIPSARARSTACSGPPPWPRRRPGRSRRRTPAVPAPSPARSGRRCWPSPASARAARYQRLSTAWSELPFPRLLWQCNEALAKPPFSGTQTRIRGRTDRDQSVKLFLFCKRL